MLEMSFLAITEKSDSPASALPATAVTTFSALSRSVVDSHLACSTGLLFKGLVRPCRSPGRSSVSTLRIVTLRAPSLEPPMAELDFEGPL